MPNLEFKNELIIAAREFLGTPWLKNHAVPGLGVDCIQFVKHVVESVGIKQFIFEDYGTSPQKRALIDVFEKHPSFKQVLEFDKGDILILRIAGLPHHVAIATSKTKMIHADNRLGVVETNIGYWQKRILAIYEVVGVN